MEQSDTATCPNCGAEMAITAEHNGIAWVGHGICHKCGGVSQHTLPDDFKPTGAPCWRSALKGNDDGNNEVQSDGHQGQALR